MSNNEVRAFGINVCAVIEKFECSLEAIDNDHGPTQGIQIHNMFCGLPGKLVVSHEWAKMELDIRNFRLQSFSNIHCLSFS